jgi:hypothetical protein
MSHSAKKQNVSSKINLETKKVKNNRVDRVIDNDNENINVGYSSGPKKISHKQKDIDLDDQSRDDLYDKPPKKTSDTKKSKKKKSHSREKSNDDNDDDDDDDDDGSDFTTAKNSTNSSKASKKEEKRKKEIIPMSDHLNIVQITIHAGYQAKLSLNNLKQEIYRDNFNAYLDSMKKDRTNVNFEFIRITVPIPGNNVVTKYILDEIICAKSRLVKEDWENDLISMVMTRQGKLGGQSQNRNKIHHTDVEYIELGDLSSVHK